jgi:hypothetical protein
MIFAGIGLIALLAERGIGTVLPDLPSTGESLTPLADVSLDDWHDAVASLADAIRREQGRCLTVAIRGGAILDASSDHGWRLAPESGERVLRDLVRATALSSATSASDVDRSARTDSTMLAGQVFSPALYNGLLLAQLPTGDRRTARLTEDAGLCDISLDGTRLWRNAEPGDDPEFALAVATDILDWTDTCASL